MLEMKKDDVYIMELWGEKTKDFYTKERPLTRLLKSNIDMKITWKDKLKWKWNKLVHKAWLIWTVIFNEDKINEYYQGRN